MKKQLLAGGIATAIALGGTLAVTTPALADTPPVTADRAPITAGADWLATQVPESGLFHIYSDFGGTVYESDDVGLTIDGVRAFEAAGSTAADTTAMTTAVDSAMPGYYDSFGTTYANAAAKAASFLLEQGVSGTNSSAALTALQGTVSDTAPIAGRIEDQDGFDGADYASPLGQGFAVQALAEAGAPELAPARTFLLAQQCAAGFFRASFASDKAATDQTCDGAAAGEAGPSVDTTASIIIALQDLAATDPVVAAALTRAGTWLSTQINVDGSFTTDGSDGSGNANSTGLAGWAMGLAGRPSAAGSAASFLRQVQLVNTGTCDASYAAADLGALVADLNGTFGPRSKAMDDLDRSVALRATAQALPALAWADGGPSGNGVTTLVPEAVGYVHAGRVQRLIAHGPQNLTTCVTDGTTAQLVGLGYSGSAGVKVALPNVTKRTVVSGVDSFGRTFSAAITALAPKTLPVSVGTKRVKQGRKTLITVSGLANAEAVKILFRGKTVVTGKATAKGTFARRIVATGKLGKANVVVVGQFTDRNRTTPVVVVR